MVNPYEYEYGDHVCHHILLNPLTVLPYRHADKQANSTYSSVLRLNLTVQVTLRFILINTHHTSTKGLKMASKKKQKPAIPAVLPWGMSKEGLQPNSVKVYASSLNIVTSFVQTGHFTVQNQGIQCWTYEPSKKTECFYEEERRDGAKEKGHF